MGAPIPQVESKPFPVELSYLYNTYKEIKFSRVPKGDAFLLIPREMVNYSELQSYSDLTGLQLQPWEINTIMTIDGTFENSRGG